MQSEIWMRPKAQNRKIEAIAISAPSATFRVRNRCPKGYEDVKTVRELRARKKELGH